MERGANDNMHKKGSLFDILYLAVGIFTLALIVLMVSLLAYHINVNVQSNDIFPDDAKTASTLMSTRFPQTMNYMIVVAFFLGCIISLILASLISVHPAFLIAYIFEWLILIWVSSMIANAYQFIEENEVLSVISGNFVLTTNFFHYFPFIIGFFGAILAIVMYKSRGKFW